jgi:hypothetical protein
MNGAILLLPLYASMFRTGKTLPFLSFLRKLFAIRSIYIEAKCVETLHQERNWIWRISPRNYTPLKMKAVPYFETFGKTPKWKFQHSEINIFFAKVPFHTFGSIMWNQKYFSLIRRNFHWSIMSSLFTLWLHVSAFLLKPSLGYTKVTLWHTKSNVVRCRIYFILL